MRATNMSAVSAPPIFHKSRSTGRNLRIDIRWATTADDIRRHVAELVALAPDVLVAGNGTATSARAPKRFEHQQSQKSIPLCDHTRCLAGAFDNLLWAVPAMTMTLTKINRNSVSLAGEFAALSQLALRGYDANMTLVSNEVCRYSCLKSCQAAFGRYGCTKSSTTD